MAHRTLPTRPDNLLGTAAEDKTGKPTAEAAPAVSAYTARGRHRLAYRQNPAKPNHTRSTVIAEIEDTVPAVQGYLMPETEHDPHNKYNDQV